MRILNRLWPLLLLALLAGPHPSLYAQGKTCGPAGSCAGTISAPGDAVVLQLPQDTATIFVTVATGDSTLVFEQSSDDAPVWVAASGTPQPSGTPATTTTGTGQWRFVGSGLTYFRVRCTSYGTITGTVTVRSSKGSAASGSASPLLNEGDIYAFIAGVNAALGIGTTGQFLISNGTDPFWGGPTYIGGVLTIPAGGSVVSPAFISNDGFNTSQYFTAGASGAHAPVASTIQIQAPASITGHNRVLASAAPSVASFPQWSAGVNGAATFVVTPTAGGAAFTQADVVASPGPPTVMPTTAQMLTLTGCGGTLAIQEVNGGSGTGPITKLWAPAVNPGTSVCSTGAGQAVTGAHGNSATVNIATVLPVSAETFAQVGRGFGATFDGGGSPVATATAYLTIPAACTFKSVNALIDQGAATFTTWDKATGTSLPTVAQTISTSGITITGQTAQHSLVVSDFTQPGAAQYDIIGIHAVPSGGATWAQFFVECD